MKRLFSILLLLNFLVFILPISTKKNTARQYLTTIPMEEEQEHSKRFDLNDFSLKLVQVLRNHNLSAHIFYLLAKEKFAHFVLFSYTIEWLETFSPPPDLA